MSDIHDPDWVSQPDAQDVLEARIADSPDEQTIDKFVELLKNLSEFDRELILSYVRRAAQMGKLKLP